MRPRIKSRLLGSLSLLLGIVAVVVNAAGETDLAGHHPYHLLEHSIGNNATFDPLEATIDGLHHMLFTGQTTCRDVVSSHIARIEVINPTINALINLDPTCLEVADRIDAQLVGSQLSGMPSQQLTLLCVPVLLKDNYDATSTVTTGGCAGMASREPPKSDAPTVRALREAGAVILGKANLHELALEGISVSSHGGQTLNPYDLTRTPGGSSGGTGAALAASLAILGTGTDTVNSLRSPASANNLVSVRPTRGLISRAGIVPVSYTQDAAGPMARSVRDLARMLTVMAGVGEDLGDNVTALVPPEARDRDYLEDMLRSGRREGGGLKGLRLGAVDGFWDHTDGTETTPVNAVMRDMMAFLRSEGVEIVNITDPVYDATAIIKKLDVQRFEYRELLTEYLTGGGGAPKSFHELYHGGSDDNKFLVIPSQYEYVNTAAVSSTSNTTYAEVKRGIQALKETVLGTFSEHRLDALVYPEQKNLVVKVGSASQSGRNGILAALTGHPVVTVPAGFTELSSEAPVGVPIGMEILGMPFSEGQLLSMAELIYQERPVRRAPETADVAIISREYQRVPEILPGSVDIPEAYPVGTLS